MKASVYTRPDKPRTVRVRERRAPQAVPAADLPAAFVEVDRATECHITPPPVAARMVEYLGDVGTGPILEPEAGTGNLIAALLAAGFDPGQVAAVERHAALCEALGRRFPDVATLQGCFLDMVADGRVSGLYRGVIMNPPFRAARHHVAAARALLSPGGVLVALVPATFEHPEASELERLPPDTFTSTTVYTKIVRIRP
jgi:phospholipid N-methyltransferase